MKNEYIFVENETKFQILTARYSGVLFSSSNKFNTFNSSSTLRAAATNITALDGGLSVM